MKRTLPTKSNPRPQRKGGQPFREVCVMVPVELKGHFDPTEKTLRVSESEAYIINGRSARRVQTSNTSDHG